VVQGNARGRDSNRDRLAGSADRLAAISPTQLARPNPVPECPLSAAEVLEIRDGRIVRGELFYDAEELRKAIGQPATG
jgi:hypothetical protein